jgi:hypothetical protein
LEDEVKILRKAAAAVEQVVPPKGRFRLVAELVDEGAVSIVLFGYCSVMCRAEETASSTTRG